MGKAMGIRKELEARLEATEKRLKELEIGVVQNNSPKEELAECQKTYMEVIERLRCHDYQKYITKTHNEGGRAGRLLARLVKPEMGAH